MTHTAPDVPSLSPKSTEKVDEMLHKRVENLEKAMDLLRQERKNAPKPFTFASAPTSSGFGAPSPAFGASQPSQPSQPSQITPMSAFAAPFPAFPPPFNFGLNLNLPLRSYTYEQLCSYIKYLETKNQYLSIKK